MELLVLFAMIQLFSAYQKFLEIRFFFLTESLATEIDFFSSNFQHFLS